MDKPIRPRHRICIEDQHIHAYQDFRCTANPGAAKASFAAWFDSTYQAIPLLEVVDCHPRHRTDHRYERWIRTRYRQHRFDGDLLPIL